MLGLENLLGSVAGRVLFPGISRRRIGRRRRITKSLCAGQDGEAHLWRLILKWGKRIVSRCSSTARLLLPIPWMATRPFRKSQPSAPPPASTDSLDFHFSKTRKAWTLNPGPALGAFRTDLMEGRKRADKKKHPSKLQSILHACPHATAHADHTAAAQTQVVKGGLPSLGPASSCSARLDACADSWMAGRRSCMWRSTRNLHTPCQPLLGLPPGTYSDLDGSRRGVCLV